MYTLVYDVLKEVPLKCIVCGTWRNSAYSRPCINPDVIERFLRENTGFEAYIESYHRVCPTYYSSQLVILQEHKPTSIDSDLQELLSKIPIPQNYEVTTNDIIKVSLAKTIVCGDNSTTQRSDAKLHIMLR